MKNIRLVKRSELDEHKWDQLILHSLPALPYAHSWYLDAIAENWDALILDDYRAAMPLVWLRKLGVKCLYQPYYCQQLGVFAKEILPVEQMQQFLQLAAKKFLYINTNLNSTASVVSSSFCLKEKKNLLLSLNDNYTGLRKKYTDNHKRNIGKAEKSGLIISEKSDLSSFRQFYLHTIDREKEAFQNKHETVFKKLIDVLAEKNRSEIYTVINAENKIVAAVMMIRHQKKLINIINSSSSEGKQLGASHFVFDHIIRAQAGTDALLDFEGSSIPGVARFYEGFGAKQQVFYNFRKVIFAK